jgi:hypothetical protein
MTTPPTTTTSFDSATTTLKVQSVVQSLYQQDFLKKLNKLLEESGKGHSNVVGWQSLQGPQAGRLLHGSHAYL